MRLTEHVPLSSLTTFKVGGNARYVATCATQEEVQTAITYACDGGLPWYVIGGGSNILASDKGYEGVIIQPLLEELSFQESDDRSGKFLAIAGAGIVWDSFVQESVTRGLWGLENLAGIPGLVGGAPVQNIGAYGADVSDTFSYVDALNTKSGEVTRFTKEECAFEYRESRFKHDPSLIILKAAFLLSMLGAPRTSYADLTAYQETGESLTTPEQIATAVRAIRAKKFPDLSVSGTAGSFFKNPIITTESYSKLKALYSDLPMYPILDASGQMTESVKIPLAWILDHVLQLRGFAMGPVRLFEKQPLVLTSELGATAQDVEVLAKEVERLVKEKTGISIEREVRILS